MFEPSNLQDLKCGLYILDLRLASAGAGGIYAQNEERDLHIWLKDLHGLDLEPYETCLELKEPWPIT